MRSPWPHQTKAMHMLRAEFGKGAKRGLLVMPTGSGKTQLSAMMIGAGVEKGRKSLFVADRRVLVKQAAESLTANGIRCGIVMSNAEMGWCDPGAPVQIVSKDTLVSWIDRPTFKLPDADLLFVDEAHRSSGESWQVFRRCYPNAWEIGLSATPVFPNGRGLGERYEFLVQPVTYAELISQGVLVEPKCFAPGSRVEGKDKGKKPTKATMVGDAVYWWKKYADGLRTFAFASGVDQSMGLRDEFRKAGVPAEHLDASTDDVNRDEALKRLATGETLVIVNCNICRYGVDVPQAECCQIMTPMSSIVDYRQSVGRVLRRADGKRGAVVIDHAGAVLYHGFPHADLPWELDAGTDHVKKQRERMNDGSVPKPIACPSCGTLYAGSRSCPACGWEPKKQAKKQSTREGTLVEVIDTEKRYATVDYCNAWRRAIAIAANRGMKVVAAATIFHKECGKWPEQVPELKPLPPSRGDWHSRAADVFPGFVRGNKVS